MSPRIEDYFVKVIFGWGILAAMFSSGPVKVNVFVGANSSNEHGFGDVNISAILNSFQMGYDKRVRPNYGGFHTRYVFPSVLARPPIIF